MPRIPESEIERIKHETDLAALVRSRGIELKPHGSKDLAGKCPFHQDDQPSFIVTPDKGLFHCMGCGAAGNCIQFVQKFDGVRCLITLGHWLKGFLSCVFLAIWA